jgi:cellulose synthase operon protein C
LKWIETNASVVPLIASEELSPHLKEFLRSYPSDVFDSLVISTSLDLLLVTDDLPTRQVAASLKTPLAVWLHAVFGYGLDRKVVDAEQYVRLTAKLIDLGHWYLGVSGPSLSLAARLDEQEGTDLRIFGSLSKVIGGSSADILSHANACLQCFIDLWSDVKTIRFRERATSILLTQLLRERFGDYKDILRFLDLHLNRTQSARVYLRAWARGHFIVF